MDGLALWASSSKLRLLLPALLYIISASSSAPLHIAALLGVIQWFNLLNRPLFSILEASYTFARQAPQTSLLALPGTVQREMAMVLGLAMQWMFELDKVWSPDILASDASPSFGFGVSRLRRSVHLARSLGRLSEKRGDFVSLDGSEPYGSRLG